MDAPVGEIGITAYKVPTDSPESDGTLQWDATTAVLVELRAAGKTGLGYTYAGLGTAKLIEEKLADAVRGRDALAIAGAWHAMRIQVRNLGHPGVAQMAVSAVDAALWDLKAKLLGVPLYRLLGPVRDRVPIYGSGGFTSYSIDQLCNQLGGWVEQGISRVKMKVGRDPHEDFKRVRAARKAIGPDAQLFVDANGAYDRKQALQMAEAFADQGVNWFEEPVSSDDLAGLRLLRDRAPAGIEITAGEYGYDLFYFRRMMDAGAVDVLQADATRCGGITGFLNAAVLCQTQPLPLSAHTAPALHLHACCAAIPLRHIEYFHDHARIEQMFFDGVARPIGGELRPDPQRPGLGLELKRADAGKYLVWKSG